MQVKEEEYSNGMYANKNHDNIELKKKETYNSSS